MRSSVSFTRSGKPVRAILVSVAIAAAASSAHAQSFFKRGGEGYFWYETPPPPAEPVQLEKKPEPPPETSQAPEPPANTGTQPFSTAWLRDNLPVLLEKAMDSGKREDMEAYLYAQRIALDKAQNFAHLQQLVVKTDPILDENNRMPLDTFIRQTVLATNKEQKDEVTKHLASKGGVFMFFDSSCSHCEKQFPVIGMLKERYGFETRFVSVDGKPLPGMDDWIPDTGQFQSLNLKLTPTVVYAVPPNNFYVIAQGAMSASGLVDRLLVVAESEKLISDEMIAAVNPAMRGVARIEDMVDGASDDPAEWVKLLKERLQGRY